MGDSRGMSPHTGQEVCSPVFVRLITSVLTAGSINKETEAWKDEAATEEAGLTCQGLTRPMCPSVPMDGSPAKVSSQRWAPGI